MLYYSNQRDKENKPYKTTRDSRDKPKIVFIAHHTLTNWNLLSSATPNNNSETMSPANQTDNASNHSVQTETNADNDQTFVRQFATATKFDEESTKTINLNDIQAPADLAELKKKDPFMYHSIPALYERMLCKVLMWMFRLSRFLPKHPWYEGDVVSRTRVLMVLYPRKRWWCKWLMRRSRRRVGRINLQMPMPKKHLCKT